MKKIEMDLDTVAEFYKRMEKIQDIAESGYCPGHPDTELVPSNLDAIFKGRRKTRYVCPHEHCRFSRDF